MHEIQKKFKEEAKKLLLRIPLSFNWEEVTGPKKERLISQKEAFSFMGNYFSQEEFQTLHNFYPISENDLIRLRKKAILSGKAFCIVKVGTEYFYCPTLERYNHIFCRFHQCNACVHCTALPTAQGGCDKVLDVPLSTSHYKDEKGIFHRFDYISAKRIEKYPFLYTAIEEIGAYTESDGRYMQCEGDRFFVFNCKNFKPCSEKGRRSIFEL